MSRRSTLFALLALALLQLAVPLRMIAKRQDALATGELLRFRAAPVDPYDAFRGRYVALAMADSIVADADAAEFPSGSKVFVRLEIDDQGFARPSGVDRRRPADGPYVEARSRAIAPGRGLMIRYPFDRYYMNEALAPAAEEAYRRHAGSTGGEADAFVTVRVKDGFAVLEELYLGGMPIGEYLRRGE